LECEGGRKQKTWRCCGRSAFLSVLGGISPRTLRFRTFLVIIDDPSDPVFEHNEVKINSESNLQAQQAEVRKYLGMINRMQRFLGFDFYNDSAIDYDVGPKATLQLYAVVNERNGFLLFYVQAYFFQFKNEAGLVRRLQGTWAQFPMDLDGSANNRFC